MDSPNNNTNGKRVVFVDETGGVIAENCYVQNLHYPSHCAQEVKPAAFCQCIIS